MIDTLVGYTSCSSVLLTSPAIKIENCCSCLGRRSTQIPLSITLWSSALLHLGTVLRTRALLCACTSTNARRTSSTGARSTFPSSLGPQTLDNPRHTSIALSSETGLAELEIFGLGLSSKTGLPAPNLRGVETTTTKICQPHLNHNLPFAQLGEPLLSHCHCIKRRLSGPG